jgi:hypothetical protein
MTVAVLFARHDSIYKTLPGCDVWDEARDARKWPGGAPVIAHPPCRAWGGLSHMARPREGERELAIWAVDRIREWGGVLEHPRASRLWKECGLPAPGKRDRFGGFTWPIHQNWFGHRARKSSLLYIVGTEPRQLPLMPLELGEPAYVVSTSRRNKDGSREGNRPNITKQEREHTPRLLAEWLVELARQCESAIPSRRESAAISDLFADC